MSGFTKFGPFPLVNCENQQGRSVYGQKELLNLNLHRSPSSVTRTQWLVSLKLMLLWMGHFFFFVLKTGHCSSLMLFTHVLSLWFKNLCPSVSW